MIRIVKINWDLLKIGLFVVMVCMLRCADSTTSHTKPDSPPDPFEEEGFERALAYDPGQPGLSAQSRTNSPESGTCPGHPGQFSLSFPDLV